MNSIEVEMNCIIDFNDDTTIVFERGVRTRKCGTIAIVCITGHRHQVGNTSIVGCEDEVTWCFKQGWWRRGQGYSHKRQRASPPSKLRRHRSLTTTNAMYMKQLNMGWTIIATIHLPIVYLANSIPVNSSCQFLFVTNAVAVLVIQDVKD